MMYGFGEALNSSDASMPLNTDARNRRSLPDRGRGMLKLAEPAPQTALISSNARVPPAFRLNLTCRRRFRICEGDKVRSRKARMPLDSEALRAIFAYQNGIGRANIRAGRARPRGQNSCWGRGRLKITNTEVLGGHSCKDVGF